MQLKSNTYYRTRDGRKAFVSGRMNPFSNDREKWPWRGWIEGRATDGRNDLSWTDNGTHWMPGYDTSTDLVEEWREPVVLWVVLRAINGEGEYVWSTHESQEGAEQSLESLTSPGRVVKLGEVE